MVTQARAMLPKNVPEWTDHNTHDPGIMLIELLAFAADQQIYALGRCRRDERLAYGRLMGLKPTAAEQLKRPAASISDQEAMLELLRTARRSLKDRPVVTCADLETATRACQGVDIEHAIVLPGVDPLRPDCLSRFVRTVILIPAGWRLNASSAAWRLQQADIVARALRPKLLLGDRVFFVVPEPVDLKLKILLEVQKRSDRNRMRTEAINILAERFGSGSGGLTLQFLRNGRHIRRLDILGWLRALPDVTGQTTLHITAPRQQDDRKPLAGPLQLPRLDLQSIDIQVSEVVDLGVR
ncbi:MAG TPA: hypothetical protein DCL48_11270 [Alphaproteobacteria bacterium]|nr:hypothetical protein [Alphaproteobacteria bacterium]